MSGISGIYNTDGRPVDGKALDRMVGALAHRGPDGRGAWFEGPCGLGHRLFHETPESLHEQQPCIDIDRQLVLTADARIDNREDLLRQLELASQDPLLVSDSRLILLAYARWGEDCVDHLLGDFAFACGMAASTASSARATSLASSLSTIITATIASFFPRN